MPLVTYTLDSAIESFFLELGPSLSREQCDEFARQHCGGTLQPVQIQGTTSYTVIAGPDSDHILQFRELTSLLDVRLLALAKHVHGDVVASCSDHGRIGEPNGPQLAVYEMERLPGENYINTRSSLTSAQRLKMVRSLARSVHFDGAPTACWHEL